MKHKTKSLEHIIHGIFLILGLITVGCVLLISVYLILSGLPAILEVGIADFLFGSSWEPSGKTDRSFIHMHPAGTRKVPAK